MKIDPVRVSDQGKMSAKFNHFQGSPQHIFTGTYINF